MLFKCKVCAWKHSKTSRHLAVENGDVTADSYSPKENLLTALFSGARVVSSHLICSSRGAAMVSEQASRSIGIEIERQQRKLHAYARLHLARIWICIAILRWWQPSMRGSVK